MMPVHITESNLDLAVNTHHAIFPYATARHDYEDAIQGRTRGSYYLLWHEDDCVGVSGMKFSDSEPLAAWLSWFGILPEYRRHGYGSIALQLFEENAKRLGFKYVRAHVGVQNNSIAVDFYRANGWSAVKHENSEDIAAMGEDILIFSKAIGDNEILPWDNRCLNLAELSRQRIPESEYHDSKGAAS